MNRSKLQIYTEILCKLASSGPMTLRNISEILDIKESYLKKHLKLLQESSLITKENFGKSKIFFTLTKTGLELLKIREKMTTNRKIDFKTMPIPI